MNPIKDMKLILEYWRIIQKLKPDVVLSYTIKPNLYGGIVCRFTNTPYIVNITGLGTAIENSGMLQKMLLKMYKIALAKAECVFFQNSANKEYLSDQGVLKTKYKMIPGSGVNVEKHIFEPYPNTNPYEDRFVFVGRIMRDKGIEEYLEAAKRVKQEYPNVIFDVIGSSDEDYSAVLKELSEKKVIRYLGRQQNIHSFFTQCNALIQPSYHEGMSNVLLEASATGRPVLASNIPGCQEAFDEGKTGFGFKVKDSDDLYKTIIRFLNLSNEQKAEMGRAARNKMEKQFNRQIVIDTYIEEINHLNRNEEI